MAGPYNALTIPIVFVGAIFTSICQLAFGNMLAPVFGAPPLALAFVFATWICLGAMYSWNHFETLLVPALPPLRPGPVFITASGFFQGWIRGVGAMYFAGSTWSGVMIVVGMLFFSRISAIMMLLGSLVGLGAAYMAGVATDQIFSGGYSYDAALTAIGVGGLFFVISYKVFFLAMLAAFMAAWLHSALQMWLLPMGLPSLNLGFNLTVIIFIMIQFSLSGIAVIPLSKISQPEAHWLKTRSLAATLRAVSAIEEAKAKRQAERELIARVQDTMDNLFRKGTDKANTQTFDSEDLSL